MKKSISLIFIILSVQLYAQKDFFYEISLDNKDSKKALEFYKNKIREIVSYKIEASKNLKQNLIEKTINSKKDSVHFAITYWLKNNGTVNTSLFGSTIHRKTKSYDELKAIVSKIKLKHLDFYKISKETKGKQIIIQFYYRKETDSSTNKTHFVSYTKKKNTKTEPLPFSAPPIYQGCRIPKKANLFDKKNQQKLKNCMSKKIDKLVKSNFNTNNLHKHPLLKGKTIKIWSQFKFDKEGIVTDIKSLSLLPELESEATRVIKKIPKVKPAIMDHKKVGIYYTKPITFRVD